MNYNPTRGQDIAPLLETLQDYYSAIIEYYDELFPTDPTARAFVKKVLDERTPAESGKPMPMSRLLSIGCATGNLENSLAQPGLDITGIDRNPDMIGTAKRRMRRAVSSIRFFEMSSIDMRRFLKAGSFNAIACLDNMLPSIGDETLVRKFFHDAAQLLAKGGALIIEVVNVDGIDASKPISLPQRGSVRVKLSETWVPLGERKYEIALALELGNGKKLQLKKGTEYFVAGADRLAEYAREAGLSSCARYADFTETPWSPATPRSVLVFSE